MKKNQPDLSRHEANLGLLAGIFPQLAPLARLLGNNNIVKTRSAALVSILKQFFLVAAAVGIFVIAITTVDYLGNLTGIEAIKGLLLNLGAIILWLPLMLIILVALNNAFDMFYLVITNQQFDLAGNELRPAKIVMIVFGFVGSLALGIILWVSGGAYLEIRVAQSREQKEYFACLDQGRDAWNKYITAGPQHNIDFSHADLSNRNFNGFFFEYVTFKHADLTGTVFEDCNLQSAWFDGAICHNTSFKNSYLNMADFIKTDLTGASLEGAFGEKNDFRKATIDPRELEKLRPPVDSRWHNTSWQDFHSPEWLRAKGYYVEAKPTAESID